jgi:hypothetical protein
MTDYFALFDEARRPWLDPEKLKEKYFARARSALPDAELNEAFRVLNDPKLRLHHLLLLEGADLTAGRAVPAAVAELVWNTGTLLREIERWLLKREEASSTLARALLSGERAQLAAQLEKREGELSAIYERELDQLREFDAGTRDVVPKLIEVYDSISYLTRLRAQAAEKRFALNAN